MKKSFFLFLSLVSVTLFAQSPVEQYKAKWFSYYYSYRGLGLKSMNFKITSPEFIDYVKSNSKLKEYYFLKAMILENTAYTTLIDFKGIPEEFQTDFLPYLEAMRRQFTGIVAEFNTFLVNSPILDIPNNATVVQNGDTLTIRYQLSDPQGNNVAIEKVFLSKSGLMLSQTTLSGKLKVVVYPVFQDIFDKWFCIGWQTQIYEDKSLITGTAVRYDLAEGDRGIWLPTNLKLKIQTAMNPGKTSFLELFLKDYQIQWLPIQKPGKK